MLVSHRAKVDTGGIHPIMETTSMYITHWRGGACLGNEARRSRLMVGGGDRSGSDGRRQRSLGKASCHG